MASELNKITEDTVSPYSFIEDKETLNLLNNLNNAENNLTLDDYETYENIMKFIDSDTIIDDMYDILVFNENRFNRIYDYVYANLKYEELQNESPEIIDNLREVHTLFTLVFKKHLNK